MQRDCATPAGWWTEHANPTATERSTSCRCTCVGVHDYAHKYCRQYRGSPHVLFACNTPSPRRFQSTVSWRLAPCLRGARQWAAAHFLCGRSESGQRPFPNQPEKGKPLLHQLCGDGGIAFGTAMGAYLIANLRTHCRSAGRFSSRDDHSFGNVAERMQRRVCHQFSRRQPAYMDQASGPSGGPRRPEGLEWRERICWSEAVS